MLRAELEAELDKLADDVLYTEKSHFDAADQWNRLHTGVGVLGAVSAALSAATVVSSVAPSVAAVLAIAAAICGALQTFLRFGDSRDSALRAGRELGNLRVKIRQLKNLQLSAATDDELKGILPPVAELATEKAEIDDRSPISSPRHYKRGKKLIERGEFK